MLDDFMDDVFKALASSVRRKLLDLLRSGPLTTGDLAAAFPELSRYAVMQHLGVLEKAGLVVPERVGRRRYNHLNPVPIQVIHDRWVSRYSGSWAQALTGIKHSLERSKKSESGPGGRTKKETTA